MAATPTGRATSFWTRRRGTSTSTGSAPPRTAWRCFAPRPAATRTTESSPTLSGSSPTRSDEFRALWAAHNVRLHVKGVKRFNHPIAGELELNFDRLQGAYRPGLLIVAYTAEPGSRSAEAFALLASWAAAETSMVPATAPSE